MFNKLYQWHKWIGLVISIPVILWALSGLLHPVLRVTKPVLTVQKYKQPPLLPEKIAVDPITILNNHKISHVRNISNVTMDGKPYYQVTLQDKDVIYFDMATGIRLNNGERIYAEYLARYYLADKETDISKIEYIDQFTDEYKAINRYLPVWKVSFLRDDGIRLFVDTESGRLAAVVDNLRANLLQWFSALHNWSYLDNDNLTRIIIFIALMAAMFFIGLSGLILYTYCYSYLKKIGKRQSEFKTAYFHRTIGLGISLSILMFSFSGGMHVWKKLNPDIRHNLSIDNLFDVNRLEANLKKSISNVIHKVAVQSISLIKLNDSPHYRIVHAKASSSQSRDKKMNGQDKKQQNWPLVSYIHNGTGIEILNAEKEYARQVACKLSGYDDKEISSLKPVTRFNKEYGFIDRRLPVVKVSFKSEDNPSYYLDLSSGKLASFVDDSKRFESFTFRMFHKWRFADSLTKNGRDLLITVFILLMVTVITLGLFVYISRRKVNN